MPLPILSIPQYANVPAAPGVPPMLRAAGSIEAKVVLLASDVASVISLFTGGTARWGIFDQAGAPVLIGDSVYSIDYMQEYRISDFPVEQGAFASYNKVQTPFEARVVFLCSGQQSLLASIFSGGALPQLISGIDPNAANRATFLNAVEAAVAALTLYNVVTPEKTFKNVNLIHYDYSREARAGATLLKVTVWCQEVRVSAQPAFSDSKQPSGTDPVSAGTVQGAPLTADQQSTLPTTDPSSSLGVASGTQPYYDSNDNLIGQAPLETPASGPIAGYAANGQPVIGGTWQNGFYDQRGNWVH